MNRSTTAREELAATLIGDAYDLVNRVESLAATLKEAHEGMREAVWLLDSRIESSKQHVAEALEQRKDVAIEEVRRKTGEFYGVSVVMQKKAMTEAAREIVSTELRPPVQELAQTLGRLVQRIDRQWRSWVTHAVTATASATLSAMLVLGIVFWIPSPVQAPVGPASAGATGSAVDSAVPVQPAAARRDGHSVAGSPTRSIKAR